MSLVSKKIGLLDNVVSSYDQTKTTIFGNVIQKTLLSQNYLAPDRVRWLDVFTDSGITPIGPIDFTVNKRIFCFSSEVSGSVSMAMYEYDPATHVKQYVGKITFSVLDSPATAHTFRAFVVADNAGTTGWKAFIVSTGSVTNNGGLYMVNNIDRNDFIVNTNFPMATGAGQKASYKLENSPFDLTTAKGIIHDLANTRIYVHNGVAATHQYYKFNYSNTITTVTGGITTDLFEFKTGNLPALTGTLLQTNSENYATPTSTVLSGLACAAFATSTSFYLVSLASLTNGGTTWSAASVDNQGAAGDFMSAPTTLNAFFSNTLQRIVWTANSQGNFFIKPFVNGNIEANFGTLDLHNLEGDIDPFVEFGMQSVDGIAMRNACMVISSNTSGQRGILIYDLRSDDLYDFSYFITPVISVAGLTLKKLALEKIVSRNTSTPVVYYRTSGFGSSTGGWTLLTGSAMVNDLLNLVVSNIQFKVLNDTASAAESNPPEIFEGYIIADDVLVPEITTAITQLQALKVDFDADHANFQSDHTNFQGDHSDLQSDHSSFQGDHSDFQSDHANFQGDHSDLQSDHSSFQGDHSDFQSDHANFQGDALAFDAILSSAQIGGLDLEAKSQELDLDIKTNTLDMEIESDEESL